MENNFLIKIFYYHKTWHGLEILHVLSVQLTPSICTISFKIHVYICLISLWKLYSYPFVFFGIMKFWTANGGGKLSANMQKMRDTPNSQVAWEWLPQGCFNGMKRGWVVAAFSRGTVRTWPNFINTYIHISMNMRANGNFRTCKATDVTWGVIIK